MDIKEGIGNVNLFILFLAQNNIVDISALKVRFSSLMGGNNIPDLMTHAGDRQEFYEVKPNSKSGRASARNERINILEFFTSENLSYVPGTVYDPDESVTLWKYNSGLFKYELSLHFFRLDKGIILYEVCTEIDGPSEHLKNIGIAFTALIAAILTKIMLKGRNLPPSGSGRPHPWSPKSPASIPKPPVVIPAA